MTLGLSSSTPSCLPEFEGGGFIWSLGIFGRPNQRPGRDHQCTKVRASKILNSTV